MKLRISDTALRDLEAIFDYIARGNPEAAAQCIEGILDAADRLLEYPRIGRPGRIRGTRELVHPPYVIVYRVLADAVSVESVLHGRRRP